jgi:hypothetical protein
MPTFIGFFFLHILGIKFKKQFYKETEPIYNDWIFYMISGIFLKNAA